MPRASPARASAGAYRLREATLWQGTQRTESGSALSRPSGISAAAVDADPVGPGVDRREGGAQPRLALAPAQLLAQLALAQLGVGRGLGRVVVAVADALGVGRQVALLERGRHLLAEALEALGVCARASASPGRW